MLSATIINRIPVRFKHAAALTHDPMLRSRDNLTIITRPISCNIKKIKRSIYYENSLVKKKANSAKTSGINHISKRHIQEFPGLKLDNKPPQDYVLILPETLDEKPHTNELIRLPQKGEPETDYNDIDAEKAFKAFSQCLCAFENYVTDVNNEASPPKRTFKSFLKEIEKHLYPLDQAYCTLIALVQQSGDKFLYKEIIDLFSRYEEIRERRLEGNFRDLLRKLSQEEGSNLKQIDSKILQVYRSFNHKSGELSSLDTASVSQYRQQLKKEILRFRTNIAGANSLFSHTIDDPDILSVVSPDLCDHQELHHRERTPFKVTVETYHKFMKLCPDRFIRQALWQTYNKRCSPKALPKLSNLSTIGNIRVTRRKLAYILGYRTYFEYNLRLAMASSKQQVLDSFDHINKGNVDQLNERLDELNNFAADNSFDDPSQLGIQEYDLSFWLHKYKHDVLIGTSETELRSYFPLDAVLNGLQDYFRNYYGLELKSLPDRKGKLWHESVQQIAVYRDSQSLGSIIFDPLLRDGKNLRQVNYGTMRARSQDHCCPPVQLISTLFKVDADTNKALLTLDDIKLLFRTFAVSIQNLLYDYEYAEINNVGGLETDVILLFPFLCSAHLLTDHRILQACSTRGGSKPIDTELAIRLTNAETYFRSFQTSRSLYMAHMDLELHTNNTDLRATATEVQSLYSPFARDPDNYDFCALETFGNGPDNGVRYCELWSKQLANFCLNKLISDHGDKQLASIDHANILKFNRRLMDALYDPNNLDTRSKLESLIGSRFEASKTALGVL